VSFLLAAISLAIPATATPAPPRIVVDRDDLVIDESCILVAAPTPITDVAGDGLVRIVGDGITVSIEGAIRGSAAETAPDRRHRDPRRSRRAPRRRGPRIPRRRRGA
jgi:hypothetical protein